MARETGKQRAQRIQIDYYRHGGGLQRLRGACVWVATAVAGLYAGYVVLFSGGGSHTSTGPLSDAHASIESDCSSCHEGFTPIDSQAVKIDLSFVGISAAKSIAHMETTCRSCHPVNHHYRDVMTDAGKVKDQNCGLCHREHIGRDNDLSHVASDQCVDCHGGLSSVCSDEPRVDPEVLAFNEQDHAGFRSLSQGDPGKVMFDHAQHLQPGQVNPGENGGFTVGMLDQASRQRYAKEGDGDQALVQLDCSSCHEYDETASQGEDLAIQNDPGRYMAQVNFEDHCQACHAMNPGIATDQTTPLPHAARWSQIEQLLRSSIAGARESGQARVPRDDSQPAPLPGAGTGDASSPGRAVTPRELAAARSVVLQQCRKCHADEDITDEAIAAAPGSDPLIPIRWLRHGLYDHGAHRQVSCKYCHAQAYGEEGAPPTPPGDHEIVMIGGIETCTGCHRPESAETPRSIADEPLVGQQPTWFSDACVTCHRYHPPQERQTLERLTSKRAEVQP